MNDLLLAWWLFLSSVWDFAVFGFTAWLVFWRGKSGWWFVFASVLTYTPTLFKALEKRFKIKDEA